MIVRRASTVWQHTLRAAHCSGMAGWVVATPCTDESGVLAAPASKYEQGDSTRVTVADGPAQWEIKTLENTEFVNHKIDCLQEVTNIIEDSVKDVEAYRLFHDDCLHGDCRDTVTSKVFRPAALRQQMHHEQVGDARWQHHERRPPQEPTQQQPPQPQHSQQQLPRRLQQQQPPEQQQHPSSQQQSAQIRYQPLHHERADDVRWQHRDDRPQQEHEPQQQPTHQRSQQSQSQRPQQ